MYVICQGELFGGTLRGELLAWYALQSVASGIMTRYFFFLTPTGGTQRLEPVQSTIAPQSWLAPILSATLVYY